MEKTEFVDRLNTDLGTEFQSIVQYVQHAATIKGAEYRSIVEELGNHLAQELEHAKILATQIDFLGGTPTVQVPPVRDCPDAPAALQADLQLEERQLQRYRDRVAEAGALGLTCGRGAPAATGADPRPRDRTARCSGQMTPCCKACPRRAAQKLRRPLARK
jgi:bacterioferritin